MKVLQVATEIFPLLKTGGLADVLGALPQALIALGADVRLVVPGLPAIADAVEKQELVCEFGPLFGAGRVMLRLGRMPRSRVPVYVVDAPYLYRRPGDPYRSADGAEWSDNFHRFAMLGWVAAHLAAGELDPRWVPDLMHAHDWHAGLACAYVAAHPGNRCATVFTVHNLAFQGLFPAEEFPALGLPRKHMGPRGLEFHNQVSFLKAGLHFAQRVTTVSPSYAREIATPEFGCGMEGVILERGADVSGILNGVDPEVWNPLTDAGLVANYSAKFLGGKTRCKVTLQAELGLKPDPLAPMFGLVSRLTQQKGLDLLLAVLPDLVRSGAQLALQGSGDTALEAAFLASAKEHPAQVAVRIGYDETFAHRLVAGSDVMLVPSRFEPCGLTQLYALRYGTLPLVRRVGGLADTVVDATDEALRSDTASGFCFDEATPQALKVALLRAIETFCHPTLWQQMMQHAMAQDFSWDGAARSYLALYAQIVQPGLRV